MYLTPYCPAGRYTQRFAPREHERTTILRCGWRFAFAFDPRRRAIVLVGGDKSGVSEKKFYGQLVEKPMRGLRNI
jgi:hypothetical protein